MTITVKSRLLAALPGAVERLFNSDDATDFFKGVKRPAKVFTADPPEGGDYWVVERESETGKWRLVAP